MAASTQNSKSNKSKTPSFIATILDSIEVMTGQKESIYSLLKDDHRKVDKLFSQIMAEEDPMTKMDLVEEMETELLVHAESEQKIFYTALQGEKESKFSALEGIEEHKIIKNLIVDLKKPHKDHQVFKAQVKVLKEMVHHHVKEEEGEMFSKAKDVLSTEQEIELGKKFLKAKEQMLRAM